jgi:outer membrane biosynthesis protein TonB
MSEAVTTSNVPTFSLKAIGLGIVVCTGVVVLMMSSVQNDPASKQTANAKQHAAVDQSRQPERIWNFALGNVVVVAPELGFAVKAPGADAVDTARVAARIEPQLLSIRNLYRTQSEKLPALMGGVLLQVTVGAQGTVSNVKEIGAHLGDTDFRKAVIAEAANWRFPEIVPEGTIIDCPLLFLREGMDIGTVIRWEKTLGLFDEKKV